MTNLGDGPGWRSKRRGCERVEKVRSASWGQLTTGHSEEGEGSRRRKSGGRRRLRGWKRDAERVSVPAHCAAGG